MRSVFKSVRLDQAGFRALALLVFVLPFEPKQRFFGFTTLQILLGLLALLALAGLARPVEAFWRGQRPQASFFSANRAALILFAFFLPVAVLSGLLAPDPATHADTLGWLSQFILTGLLTAGIYQWMKGRTGQEINRLIAALVGGAIISAGVGLGEFLLGTDFANSLVNFFKEKPTVAGPYLRLSGTFSYANTAAMYFEMVWPFALLGLVKSLENPGPRRWLLRLTWTGANLILLEAILLTMSRGAWLGVVVGLVVMTIAVRGHLLGSWGWWKVPAIGGGLILGLAGLNFMLVPQLGLRLDSQSDQDWYQASFTATPPARMAVCQQITLAVTIQNKGALTWGEAGQPPYYLSYHWLDETGQVVEFDGIRTGLKGLVKPGSSITLETALRAPAQPGRYGLVWDMVQGEGDWFSLKSARYTIIPVQVVAGEDVAPKGNTCVAPPVGPGGIPRPAPRRLPETVNQPDRTELWPAALRMIAAYPLLGVGPNGFRLNYGYFTKPVLVNWNKNIFANNLLLEFLADLGLVGGGLLVIFIALLLLPLLGAVRRGDVLRSEQVALTGALAGFFGHSLVDYILGATAINLLFWILVGLAISWFNKCKVKESAPQHDLPEHSDNWRAGFKDLAG